MLFLYDLLTHASRLKVRHIAGQSAYYDPTRQLNVAITPEEMVRQALMLRLHEELKVPYTLMKSEQAITIGKLRHRIDLIVYNRKAQPIMIVETKSPEVKLTQKVATQAAIYNSIIFAPLLLIANGINAMIFEINFEDKSAIPLAEIPKLELD